MPEPDSFLFRFTPLYFRFARGPFILDFSGLQCTPAAIFVVGGWIDLLVSLVVSYIDVCFEKRRSRILEQRAGGMKRGVCDPIVVFSALEGLKISRVVVRFLYSPIASWIYAIWRAYAVMLRVKKPNGATSLGVVYRKN